MEETREREKGKKEITSAFYDPSFTINFTLGILLVFTLRVWAKVRQPLIEFDCTGDEQVYRQTFVKLARFSSLKVKFVRSLTVSSRPV